MAVKKISAPSPAISLLEQARKLSAVANHGVSPEYRQEAEVYIAWVMGEIDTSAVAKVLQLNHASAIASKAGTALRNCATAGLLTITWKT